jgi:molybdate transport system ATP-binding protein
MSIYCDIKKRLGNFKLSISFEAEDETVALMGASGCGKSMTLKCIAGIETPDEGTIVINGVTVFDSKKKINMPPGKRHTGFLFQDYALFPNMTVQKNIEVALPKDKKSRVCELIEAFHLAGLEGHYPSQLSGGQKQRCAIARMLATDPQIILLDEPFSALDSYLRWKLEQEIMTVIESFDKTVLFVSHNRDEVFRISDIVVVMKNGKNEEIKEKHQLYDRPETYADALLTGCKNILPCKIIGNRIIVPGYGIEIHRDHLAGSYNFLGFRAQLIRPGYEILDSESALFFEYTIIKVIEAVFTIILMVRLNAGEELIQWEVPKEKYQELLNHANILAIEKKDVLLLSK